MKISSGVIFVIMLGLSTTKSTMRMSLASTLTWIGLIAATGSLPAQEPAGVLGKQFRQVEADVPLSVDDGPATVIMAIDGDGTNLRTVASVPHFPIINSPEVSPDGEWIGVDGWKHGQTNVDAHLLLIHLKTGIVSDLGTGAMPTWSADGRWIAFSRYSGGCFIGRVNEERERQIEPNGWAITWSPDGQSLAFVKGRDLIVQDVRSGVRREVFGDGKSPYIHIMHNPEWSPDDSRICVLGRRPNGKTEFTTVSADGPEPDLQICCNAEGFNPDIGWSKDGRRLIIPRGAAVGRPAQLYVYDFETKGEPTLLEGQPSDRHNHGNDWSPDGKTLYFASTKI